MHMLMAALLAALVAWALYSESRHFSHDLCRDLSQRDPGITCEHWQSRLEHRRDG